MLLLFLLAALGVMMLAAGGTQPLNPALRGFVEGCEGVEGLCWYGMVSYTTRLAEARDIANAAGYSLREQRFDALGDAAVLEHYGTFRHIRGEGCATLHLAYPPNVTNPEVIIAAFEDCHNLLLGDVMGLFGTPRAFTYGMDGGDMVFANQIHAVFSGALDPRSPVERLWVYVSGNRGGLYFTWYGFRPFWSYCPNNMCYP
jgi:hypothetical protein